MLRDEIDFFKSIKNQVNNDKRKAKINQITN